jgi:hypothetical protein
VVNKHHVISHSHDLLQPCNKDLDRADSIVLSCYNTNLYSYLPQVVNPQRLPFSQIHLFFLDPNFKAAHHVFNQAPASTSKPNQKNQHLHAPCLHIFPSSPHLLIHSLYIYFATPPSILSSCSSSCSSTNNHFSFLSFPLSVFVLFSPQEQAVSSANAPKLPTTLGSHQISSFQIIYLPFSFADAVST